MCRSWPVFCGKFIKVGGLSSFLPYFNRKALGQEMPVFALEILMKLPASGILKSIKNKNVKGNKEIYYVLFIDAQGIFLIIKKKYCSTYIRILFLSMYNV